MNDVGRVAWRAWVKLLCQEPGMSWSNQNSRNPGLHYRWCPKKWRFLREEYPRSINNPGSTGLIDGKIYRKPLFAPPIIGLSCRFSRLWGTDGFLIHTSVTRTELKQTSQPRWSTGEVTNGSCTRETWQWGAWGFDSFTGHWSYRVERKLMANYLPLIWHLATQILNFLTGDNPQYYLPQNSMQLRPGYCAVGNPSLEMIVDGG